MCINHTVYIYPFPFFSFCRTRSIFQFGLPTDTCIESLFKITTTKKTLLYYTRSNCDTSTRIQQYSNIYYVRRKRKLEIKPHTLIL